MAIAVNRFETLAITFNGQNKIYFGEQPLLDNVPIAYVSITGTIPYAYSSLQSLYLVLVDRTSHQVINQVPLIMLYVGHTRGQYLPVYNKCIDWSSSYILCAYPGNYNYPADLKMIVGVTGEYQPEFEPNNTIDSISAKIRQAQKGEFVKVYFDDTPKFKDKGLLSMKLNTTNYYTPNFVNGVGSNLNLLQSMEITLIDSNNKIIVNDVPLIWFSDVRDTSFNENDVTDGRPFAFYLNKCNIDWAKSYITFVGVGDTYERECFLTLLLS